MAYKYLYKTPSNFSNIILTSDGTYLTGLWFEKSKSSIIHEEGNKEKDLEIFRETCLWLDIYFSGKIPDFTPKYKILNITPFRQEVSDIMKTIEYGKVITYKDISTTIAHNRKINRMSSQAVGGAVGWNPIGIIIPCHRVVGTNNKLIGYGGGLNNKIELLKLEGVDIRKYS